MLKTEEWKVECDATLKSGELKIHEKLHDHMSRQPASTVEGLLASKRNRVSAIELALTDMKTDFHGKILEVGAGNGWCSAYLCSRFPRIEHAHVLEIDRPAVERLIPQTMEVFGIESFRYTTVRGSFNQIPRTDYFDFVVAMGALHHSENLYCTLRSLFQSLRMGGYLIAQEPMVPDLTPNSYYDRRLNEKVMFQNLQEVWNHERSDIFYRRCEYVTAAVHAGFDLSVHDLTTESAVPAAVSVDKSSWLKRWMSRGSGNRLHGAIRESGMQKKSNPPKQSEQTNDKASEEVRPTNLLLVAQKNVDNQYVPATRWES